MKDGLLRVASVTPKIRVADPQYNAGMICKGIREACAAGARILVFPELVLTPVGICFYRIVCWQRHGISFRKSFCIPGGYTP